MSRYIVSRVLLIVPTLLIVTIVVFSLVRLIPGDVVNIMIGEQGYAKDADEMRVKLGIDRPIHEQYLRFVSSLVRGDLGRSFHSNKPVLEELLRRLPITAELAILALTLSLSISIPIGIVSAIRQDSMVDYVARSFSIGMLAMPGFWLATLAIVLPSLWFRWTPSVQYTPLFDDPYKNLQHVFLPALLLGAHISASVMRMSRTMMLEVLRQDYVRTAWAKGLRERTVVVRHVIKNAMIPVVTILGLQLAQLLGGAVIFEQIFAIPGLGRYLLEAIQTRDYTAVQGVNLFIATMVILINLSVDLTYSYLDPRVRYR